MFSWLGEYCQHMPTFRAGDPTNYQITLDEIERIAI
jgi:hypothetical protein